MAAPTKKQIVKNPFEGGPSVNRAKYTPDLNNRAPSLEHFKKDVNPDTGAAIVGALVDFAGVAGNEYVASLNKKVEEDKIKQSALAQRHEKPSDDATRAGYLAHVEIGMKAETLNQQYSLNAIAAKDITNEQWDEAVSKSYATFDKKMAEQYPQYETDKDMQKLGVLSTREMVTQAGAARAAAKAGYEQQHRFDVSKSVLINASKLGAVNNPEALSGQLTQMLHSLKMTPSEKDNLVIEAAIETEDPGLLALAKTYKGDFSTTVYQRSTKLKTLDAKLFRKDIISRSMEFALIKTANSKAVKNGSMSKAEWIADTVRRNKETQGNFMSESKIESTLASFDRGTGDTSNNEIQMSMRMRHMAEASYAAGATPDQMAAQIMKYNNSVGSSQKIGGSEFNSIISMVSKKQNADAKAVIAKEKEASIKQGKVDNSIQQNAWIDEQDDLIKHISKEGSTLTWDDFVLYANAQTLKYGVVYASPARMKSLKARYEANLKFRENNSAKVEERKSKMVVNDKLEGLKDDLAVGAKTPDEVKAEIRSLNEVSGYKAVSASDSRRVLKAGEDIAAHKSMDTYVVATLCDVNASGFHKDVTDTAIQRGIASLIKTRANDTIRASKNLPEDQRQEFIANENARNLNYVTARTIEKGVVYEPFVDDLTNLANVDIAIKLDEEGNPALTEKATSTTQLLQAMSPSAKYQYMKAMGDVNSTRVLKSFDHFVNDRQIDPIVALERSRAFRLGWSPAVKDVDKAAKRVNSGIHAILREDVNPAQKEFMETEIRTAVMAEPFPNSDSSNEALEQHFNNNYTVTDDGTWLKGQPGALSKATGMSPALFGDAMKGYKKEMAPLIAARLSNQALTMDDVFVVSDPTSGSFCLSTKSGKILNTTIPMSQLNDLYLKYNRPETKDERIAREKQEKIDMEYYMNLNL